MNFNRWFKAQGSDVFDMRLQKLPASLFLFHYNLRCLAACNGGRLPSVEEIGFLLRSSPAVVERRLAALTERGLLEETDGALRLVDWTDGPEAQESAEPLSGAERTRRWRERQARDVAIVTSCDAVTPLEKESDSEKETESHTARDERAGECDDSFDRFMAVFPQRDDGNPRAPSLAAWRRAIADGADPEQIIAAAQTYSAATSGRERRYIASAVRWLSEARWRVQRPASVPLSASLPPGVWIASGSREWTAWADYWQSTKGKSPPTDCKNGWRFPALVPPGEATRMVA